jgi:chondroitin AC lyase
MAVAYNREGHAYYHNSAMLQGISRGLDYWYTRNPVSDNWWYNDIGQQLQLGPALIMMEEFLSAQQVETGCTYLNDPSMTGQNLVWVSTQTVQRGCLRESLQDINLGLDAIKSEVRITTEEGIQPDFAFHQHGPQLYNGGYGRGFQNDVSYWMYMSRGLPFAFSQEKIAVFSGLVLDGTQWMVRRGQVDPVCRGREISRPNSGRASGIAGALGRMIGMDTPRNAEFQAFSDHIEGNNDAALTGNKHFWRADVMTHRRDNYHISVKMCSQRTAGTEYMNDENKRAYYLPFGMTAVMCSGDEYDNIFPIWDWALLPGVTCPYKNPPPNMTTYIRGTTDFAGGASNGTYGAAGFDLDWDGVTGRKSWFFFDREFVSLGVGITGSGGSPVNTSLNQCRQNGAVWVSYDGGGGSSVSNGQRTLNSPRWAHHDNVGYVFPGVVNVELKNQAQSGSWNAINSTYSSNTITEDVFSLWIEHGADPTDASYEYIIVPGADRTAVQAYAQNLPVRTIINTAGVQAVRHDGLGIAGIVFYQAGQVEIKMGMAVRVDQPCIVLVDETRPNTGVTVSNPVNQPLTVNVDLVFADNDDARLTFNLPDGGEAGRSVTLYHPPLEVEKKQPVFLDNGDIELLRTFQGAVLRFYVQQEGLVEISLIRPNGRVVTELVNEVIPKGEYVIPVGLKKIPAGMYLLRFRTGMQSHFLKIIL